MGYVVKRKKTEGNQKVRNAVKSTFNGIKFKSNLEVYFYKLCLENKLNPEIEPKFILQPKFEYQNEKVREITYSPDFFLKNENIIIETKGFYTDSFKIKRKMFLYYLLNQKSTIRYVILKNQKECKQFIDKLCLI